MDIISRPVEPVATEYLSQKAARLHIPLNGTFELTPQCNMACKMCYVRMTQKEQEAIAPLGTTEQWLRLGEETKKQGALYLLLTGGEPFLRPDMPVLLRELQRMGFLVSINTNGTLLDEAMVDMLKQYPPVRMNITVYGASDESYARLCGNPRGFTQVDRAVTLLQKAGIPMRLNCSLTPYNKDDMPAIYGYGAKRGLHVLATPYMFPPLRRGMPGRWESQRLSPEETAYYQARINLLTMGEDRFLEKLGNIEPFPEPEDCGISTGQGQEMQCRAGRCGFWVTWDGRLLPCGMFPGENAPNVFRGDFAAAWKQVVAETEALRLPAKCAACSIKEECKTCAAMVITETGDFGEAPVYRCAMMKAYPEACRRVARELREERSCDHEE